MAGRGPAPKNAAQRVRKGSQYEQTVIEFVPAEQPPLPDTIPWPDLTLEFWAMLKDEPWANLLTASDWEYLAQTAIIHAGFWSGDTSLAGELRIRMKDYGISLTGRAALRLQFAEADEKDSARPEQKVDMTRFGNLRAVPDAV